MSHRPSFASAFFILSATCSIFIEGAASVDNVVSNALEKGGGVGLAAWSIDAEGKLCSRGVSGERIKGSGQPLQLTGDSRYHVGSVTKSMTSSLLAILIEDGMLENGWDATMAEILPFAEEGNYANATLRQVAGMISGIPNELNLTEVDSYPYDPNDVPSIRRAVAMVALDSTPVSPPGTSYLYSNWAYIVAGHIIEELTGEAWENVLSRRLFLPLGVDLGDDESKYTGAPNNAWDPWGHIGVDQKPCDPSLNLCDNNPVLGPAGTASPVAAAMARYFAWHLQCHNGDIPEDSSAASLLSTESCRKLHEPADPQLSSYGYGWLCYNSTDAGGLVCTHNGSNTMNYYNVTLAFEMDRAFVGYTNGLRPEWEDVIMVHETIMTVLTGDYDECDERLTSITIVDEEPSSTDGPTDAPAQVDTTSSAEEFQQSVPTLSLLLVALTSLVI